MQPLPPSTMSPQISKNVSSTKTLPNVKPVMGRQRSISDLLTSDVETAASAPPPTPPMSQTTPYNPYSGDRSLSIPPPTPPPVRQLRQSQAPSSQESVNRAISLPPGPSSPAAAKTKPGTGDRSGLPPPHPLHVILMANKQHEMEQNVRQDSVTKSQDQAPSRAPPAAPSGLAPPPPPPPPPPPGSLGVVAKHGPSGVPIATRKPVKATLTLAEIRIGNTNYGPPSPQPISDPEPVIPPPQSFSTDTGSTGAGQQEKPMNDFIAPTAQQVNNLNENAYNEITDADFMKTLNDFEAQRNAMLHPQTAMSMNSDTPRHQMLLREVTSPVRVEKTFANENIYHEPYAAPVSKKDVPQLVNSADQFRRETESRVLAEIKVNATAPSQDQTTLTSSGKDIRMNDDINMLRHKDNHSPRPQSLQKNCQEHNVTPKAFNEESKKGLDNQSLDKDDAELTAIADSNKSNHISRERRNSHNIVRYRPETPRTVTPVRFTPIPRLPNKGFKSPEPEKVRSPGLKSPTPSLKSPEPETGFIFAPSSISQGVKSATVMSPPPVVPLSSLTSEPPQPLINNPRHNQAAFKNSEVAPPPRVVRNVSDSGISVDSNNSDVDDTAGKIVAESMLKIEAQMKRILEHENKNKGARESNRNSSNLSSPLPDDTRNERTNGCKLQAENQVKENTKCQTPPCLSPFESSDRRGSVKTGSFEIMEDFEEAPEEFDLGISSYSIAHPIDNIANDGAEKSKCIPDIVETDDYSKLPLEDTPYVVSTPSGTLNRDTLDNQSGHQPPPPVNNVTSINKNYDSVPNPAYQQQPHFPNDMSSETSQLGEMPSFFDPFVNNAFGMMGMTGMPAPVMDNQFSTFPSMFDNQFQQQQMDIMKQNLNSFGLKPHQHQSPRQHQHQQQRSEERIIPIQVIKSPDTSDQSPKVG